MSRKLTAVFAVMIMLCALPSFAAVTFDPATGNGFVGKGDVIDALGFHNNKSINDYVLGGGQLVFRYTDVGVAKITCVKDNSSASNAVKYFSRTRDVNSAIDWESRTNKNQKNLNLNGFWLTGYAEGNGSQGEEADCPADQAYSRFSVSDHYDLPGVTCAEVDGQPALPCTFLGPPQGTVYDVYVTSTVTGADGGVLTVDFPSGSDPKVIWPPLPLP